MLKVLVVDDDAGLRLTVKNTLSAIDYFDIDEAFDGVNALEKVMKENYNIVILDVDMPRMSGLEALKKIKQHDPSIIVLILTAYSNVDDAIQAVKNGAYNYLSKPIQQEALVNIVENAISAHKMIADVAASAPILNMDEGKKIIGKTSHMRKVFNIIDRLSKVNTPVLVRGSSGTGKELIARAIHMNSGFKEGNFVAINCSAIPENLFESELFGHEKGAFTGADQRKIGKFQYAEGGTLFLDEVGDMPQLMQVKLLRVLQEKVFVPVGSNREIQTNVRVIAATNRPLEDMIKSGDFREDLYYRLNVMPIFLPALSERKEDIQSLTNTFIRRFNKKQNMKITGVSSEVEKLFNKYDWPGNIRELENIIEHAFILEDSHTIQIRSLPESFLMRCGIELADPLDLEKQNVSYGPNEEVPVVQTEDSPSLGRKTTFSFSTEKLDFNSQKETFEKEFIISALKKFNGRINQTALHANIPKKTLLRKIEKYGIIAKDYAAL